jgi:hypothetical protein
MGRDRYSRMRTRAISDGASLLKRVLELKSEPYAQSVGEDP